MGHLDGCIKAPNTADPSYDKWEIENSIIMALLINSIMPEIGESYHGMKTTQDTWDLVASTYSRKGNYAQEFESTRSIDSSKQGNMIVTQYFTFLTTSWN